MYFVISGEVHLVRQSMAGSEIILQRAHQGFLAEASPDQTAYHCDAVAVLASKLLTLSRKAFCDGARRRALSEQLDPHLTRECAVSARNPSG